jgi:uncharacterized protein (TIGR02118 family)
VATVAVTWGPDPRQLAVADQGPYARGRPFAACVVASGDLDPARVSGTAVWAWHVEETRPRAGPADCEVAMVSLMRRRPGTTPGEFATHWRERHAPLALRHHVGLADYHQYVVTETLTPDAPEIDGIAWLGFLTRADFDGRFFDSDAGRAAIMADVAQFMDRPGPETTLVGPARAPG